MSRRSLMENYIQLPEVTVRGNNFYIFYIICNNLASMDFKQCLCSATRWHNSPSGEDTTFIHSFSKF